MNSYSRPSFTLSGVAIPAIRCKAESSSSCLYSFTSIAQRPYTEKKPAAAALSLRLCNRLFTSPVSTTLNLPLSQGALPSYSQNSALLPSVFSAPRPADIPQALVRHGPQQPTDIIIWATRTTLPQLEYPPALLQQRI